MFHCLKKQFPITVVIFSIALMTVCSNAEPLLELEKGFSSPPDSSRPWVYWFIMDGNLDREGITADFEAMKRAGIGGLILMEVNVGIPRGSVEFMSEEWRTLFKHAVEEAERLGLEMTLNAGPGWTGSGGPWVKAEQSMQHLVASETQVTGPTSFDSALPLPEPRKPYFGDTGLPAELLKTREAFYVDVAVLAVPRTDDKYRISDIDEKALYLRHPYTSRPSVKPFIPAPASFEALPPGAAVNPKNVIDLTGRLESDGRLTWNVPAGDWTILRFGRRNTGANTRPAPKPGLGLESDKFDPAALDAHFDAFIGTLLDTIGPRPVDRTTGWTMLHIDSWEMGSQNWTAGFRKMFQRRRGYDPLFYLPVMTGRVIENLEISERFLWDLRLTAQELVIENHARHLKELGHRHGFGLSIEPYDMNPTSDLALGGVADVPMCEFWSHGYGFDSVFTCFEAASVAHTNGRKIVAAESFTAGSKEAWKLFPAAMKDQGDWALCTGINRFAFHRFAHQPWLNRRPGMTMGPYGVHWDRTQTWWPMVSAYHRYLARCQFLLRQGAPVGDIIYLIPEGAPHVFRPPSSALEGPLKDRRGYHFDGCEPQTLIDSANVNDGRIIFPGGASYRLLVLPSFDTMTPALLRKIKDLVESGATVVGSPPRKSPSLSNYPQCDREVQILAADLWGTKPDSSKITRRKIGSGLIVTGSELNINRQGEFPELYPDYEFTANLLGEMGLPPDFEADAPIRHIHRRVDDRDFYFVANRMTDRVKTTCVFRVKGKHPQLWDPLTGEIRPLPEYEPRDGRVSIPMIFEPHQSFFIVFQAKRAHPTSERNFPERTRLAQIDGPWNLTFDEALGGPTPVIFQTLQDWSQRSEPGIKYYSGTAVYKTSFDLPQALHRNGDRLSLDLGTVHNLARVFLNGHDLDVLWCDPWQVDITDVVKEKANRLEIHVANLWPNRLIGDKNVPPERQIAWTTWNPYKPDDPLLPSGLMGPVTVNEIRD